jgi:dTDP-4-dehydrorhamnose reductase
VVSDQTGSPTWTFDLSEAIIALLKKHGNNPVPYGIYHFTNEGIITWFDFAKAIYATGRKLGILNTECIINPCSSEEFPAKVKRPHYSVLDKTKIKRELGISIPDWHKSLEMFLMQTGNKL